METLQVPVQNKSKLGIVQSGAFTGRHIILPSLPQQRWVFIERGADNFYRACLVHEDWIADQGCDKCLAENYQEQLIMKA